MTLTDAARFEVRRIDGDYVGVFDLDPPPKALNPDVPRYKTKNEDLARRFAQHLEGRKK